MNDEALMELALAEARLAAELGEVPVGAVIICQGKVIAKGRNSPVNGHDPTAHAEIMALRGAAVALGNYRLDDCELFVTLEPCAMCSGAMLNARLKRVVFGAPEPKTGAAGSVINLFAHKQLNHQTKLEGGVLAEKSRFLLQGFFRQRRMAQREAARKNHPLRDDALRTPDAAFDEVTNYPWAPHYVSDLPALGGLRMHYLDEDIPQEKGRGVGLTYFCLHGSQTWSYVFHRLIPILLANGHRVVAPDLIGFGKSDKPKKENFHTFERHRQILLEWVERLDLHNTVLVLPEEETWLGLTLPMAAPQRYHGVRLMKTSTLTTTDDFPLSEGAWVWKKTVLRREHAKDVLPAQGCPESVVANEIPFPSRSFSAGLRAFQFMTLTQTMQETEMKTATQNFWQRLAINFSKNHFN